MQKPLTEETTPQCAFLTDDPIEIMGFARDSLRAGIPCALVTLVDVELGAARLVGAQMSVRLDGLYCGFVSGGCTEAVVAAEAVQSLRKGRDGFLRLGKGSAFFDIVLPCGGAIRLAIHVIKQMEVLDDVLRALQERRLAGICYDPATESIGYHTAPRVGWDGDVFFTSYAPNLQIFLFGRSIELATAERVAKAAGYGVHVNECGAALAHSFDRQSAIALLYHDLDRELPVLKAALASQAFYIGALGSSRTHAVRRRALEELGFEEADIARIKAPIGIFDKARDSSAIAMSVVADISWADTRARYEAQELAIRRTG